MLARREHSERELMRKLRKRGFVEADIHQLLDALLKEKLLSNDRFVESYIHHRRSKGLGPLRIQAELIERGISEELIEHQLKITDNAWFAEVRRVWQKRFKNHLPEDFKSRMQQVRFLQYRGFTSEQIESLFKK